MLKPLIECMPPLPLCGEAKTAFSARTSPLEDLVIHLFGQFRDPMLRYTMSLGLSVQDSEDVIQEAFLALFHHLRLRRSPHNLRGWLFRVAHNLALKQHRANSRFGAGFEVDEDAAHIADVAPSPEDEAASNQHLRRIQAVVRALPERDRCCLNLRAEGLRYREIASVLGISLGSVSMSLGRSFTRLISAEGGRHVQKP